MKTSDLLKELRARCPGHSFTARTGETRDLRECNVWWCAPIIPAVMIVPKAKRIGGKGMGDGGTMPLDYHSHRNFDWNRSTQERVAREEEEMVAYIKELFPGSYLANDLSICIPAYHLD